MIPELHEFKLEHFVVLVSFTIQLLSGPFCTPIIAFVVKILDVPHYPSFEAPKLVSEISHIVVVNLKACVFIIRIVDMLV